MQIRTTLTNDEDYSIESGGQRLSNELDRLLSTSEEEVKNIIRLCPPKICRLDSCPTDLLNYRPVSNIAFVAKVLEKFAVRRLLDHLTLNGLHEEYQSAYKMLHSTETALLRVQHDISSELDKNRALIKHV